MTYLKKIALLASFMLCIASYFQLSAQCDPGKTPFTVIINGGASTFPEELSWNVICDVTGDTVINYNCGSYIGGLQTNDTLCVLDSTDYTFQALDDWGDGWNGGTYEISFTKDGCVIASGTPNDGLPGDAGGGCNGSSVEVSVSLNSVNPVVGCTNPLGVNYDPCATVDDGSCIVAAPNDLCENAVPIFCNDSINGSTVNASISGNPSGLCGTEPEAPGVWYIFEGTGQEITASLCSSAYDTRLNVYTGDCSSPVCVGGNDDFCSTRSQFTWNSNLGQDYFILVNGWNNETGTHQIILSCDSACAPQPSNDLCNNPDPLSLNDTCINFSSSNFCASPATVPPSCDQFGIIQDVWFTFNSGPFDNVNLNITPTTASTVNVALYTQCGGTELGCLQDAVTEFNIPGLTPNTDYQLQIWNSGGIEEGAFELCLTFPFIPPPPTNDTCETAFDIVCGQTLFGSTNFAGDSDNPNTDCGVFAESSSVWYRFVGGGEYATAALCGADFDTKLLVFEGECGAFTCIGGNDDACGTASIFSWNTDSGAVYHLLVSGTTNAKGDFGLALSCIAPCLPVPGNDLCSNPDSLILEDTCLFVMGTNACATSSFNEPNCDPFGNIQDVWYKFNTGADTSVELTLSGITAGPLSFAIYDACDSTELASSCNLNGPITIIGLNQVSDYLLQVWNNGNGAEGTFNICLRSIIGANVPLNDQCFQAQPINCGETLLGRNTFSSPNGPPICDGEDADGPGVWYAFVGTGELTKISTCDPSTTFDTELHVYKGTCSGLVCVGANDQDLNCTQGPEISASSVLFQSESDTTYYIFVNGFQGASGFFNLSVECIGEASNDSCSQAISIMCGDTINGTTIGSTADSMGTCGVFNESPGVWYHISGTDDQVTLSLCGSSFDTKISVFEGDCNNPVCIDGNDDFCDLQSKIELTTVAGTDYYVLVHGFADEVGSFSLSVNCGSLAPANDSCSNAISLVCGDTARGSTRFAGTDSSTWCGLENNAPEVWYTVQGDGSILSASLCGSSYDTKLLVLEGTCGNFTCTTTNDDNCGLQSRSDWVSSAGVTYYVVVSGFGTASGEYELILDCSPLPTNDDCAQAISMSCGDTLSGTTVGATQDSPEFCSFSVNSPSVWYSTTGTGEVFSVSSCGSTFYDTRISVFSNRCDSLVCVAANDDDFDCSDGHSTVEWVTDSGAGYYILVHGTDSAAGFFELSLTCSELVVPGCTDSNAVNYNPMANADDTSCIYSPDTCGPGFGEVTVFIGANASAFASEMSWNIICIGTGDTIFEAPCGSISGDAYEFVCLDSSQDYTFNAYDDWGDGWNLGTFEITHSATGCLLASGSPNNGLPGDENSGCTGSSLEASVNINIGNSLAGCTDPIATNYNPCAVIDDGSCDVPGCTDPFATNYDANATTNDGSCTYAIPANDSCIGAIAVTCTDTISGTTNGATENDNPAGTCGEPAAAPGIWYSFTGTGQEVTASLCNSTFDTRISVYSGDCNSLVCIGGDDDFCFSRSQFTFSSNAGTEYFILVNGWNGATGTFELAMSCITPCTPAVTNDDPGTKMALTIGDTCAVTIGDNSCASAGSITPSCDPTGLIQDVWYGFTPGPVDTSLIINLNTLTATKANIAVYTEDTVQIYASCSGDSVHELNNLITGHSYSVQVWNNNAGEEGSFEICVTRPELAADITLGLSVFLEGPFVSNDTMHDNLRTNGLIPLLEPYTSLGFTQVAPGGGELIDTSVLMVSGLDAIVDWVLVELRNSADSAQILATRSALLQKDGDIVDLDGVSQLSFSGVTDGDYFIAVRHRNHLGVMTQQAVGLVGGVPTLIKFFDPSTPVYGVEAQKLINGTSVLWAGNVIIDNVVKYSGSANDRDEILVRIGGVVPTNTVIGYHVEDVNLDAVVKYSGQFNDRDIILVNIGGIVPTNVRIEQIPQ